MSLLIIGSLVAVMAVAAPKRSDDSPYQGEYIAGANDFKLLERGMRQARKVEEMLFPSLLDRVDVVLYDTKYLYVYSRDAGHALPKWRRRAGYQVYRLEHGRRPSEREMARCSGGTDVVDREIRKQLSEEYFACAPWGTFGAIQKKRRSVYQFEQGYLATIIHEFAHQFEFWQPQRTVEMAEIRRILSGMKLKLKADPESAAGEGFASWCELEASKKLYAEHFRRMLSEAAGDKPDDLYAHGAGLKAAVALFKARRSKRS